MNKTKPSIAVIPGSFDPITYGHLDLVDRASSRYDKVYLAVMINRDKHYMLSLEERTKIAEAAVEAYPNVEVISSEGMLWELALRLNACAIVKGYRNDTDLAYEQQMAEFNRIHNPKAQTVLLESKSDLINVSSTVVRDKIQRGEDLGDLMPPRAEKILYQILQQKKCSK